MDAVFTLMSPQFLVLALCVGLFAGIVKGLVGFAMPMILISGLTMFLPPEIALAGLILPTVVTNGVQALRQGARAAWGTICRFRVFLGAGGLLLIASAQMVQILEAQTLFLIIGISVTVFSAMQLLGWQPKLPEKTNVLEGAIGAFAGFIGGLSGVWGPPTVAYLTAIETPKAEQMRAQGVIYGLGAVLLLVAHVGSGVVSARTLPFSALLVAPALIGMGIGFRLQDRIAQHQFKRLTLLVLLIGGLNLIRRGVMG